MRPGTYTQQYNIHRLVYIEYFRYVRSALSREKELKHWTRAQKLKLIESVNPTWADLLPSGAVLAQLEQQVPCGNDRKKGESC